MKIRLNLLTLSIITFVFLFSSAAQAQESDALLQFQLSNQLKKSAAQWNRGDLDGFLNDYLQSGDMTFTSGGQILKGFEALSQRYRRNYGDSPQTMGRLSFSDLEVWSLGRDKAQALVVGRWRLVRDSAGQDQVDEGVFTLVMVQLGQEWKILHDHTSSSR